MASGAPSMNWIGCSFAMRATTTASTPSVLATPRNGSRYVGLSEVHEDSHGLRDTQQVGNGPKEHERGQETGDDPVGRLHPGTLTARTSTFSMEGGDERSSGALAISAAATRPDRCACRPASSGKASKMPKVEGPRRMANHALVAGSP